MNNSPSATCSLYNLQPVCCRPIYTQYVGVRPIHNAVCGRPTYTVVRLWLEYIHGSMSVVDLYTRWYICGRPINMVVCCGVAIYTVVCLLQAYIHGSMFVVGLYTWWHVCGRSIYTVVCLWQVYIHGSMSVGGQYTRQYVCGRPIYMVVCVWQAHTRTFVYTSAEGAYRVVRQRTCNVNDYENKRRSSLIKLND